MTRRERIRATLAGQPTDRPPVSLWRHFYDREGSAEALAHAMVEFQETYDWDFMKVNPRASYHVEDWGVRTQRPGNGPLDKPKVVHSVVREPEDWDRIRPLDVRKGVLAEHLDAEERIAARVQGEVDWVMTVFNPISIAADLVNDDARFVEHLRHHGERVHGALRAITETFVAFTRETMARGAAGLFFATTDWGNATRIDRALMEEFGRPYDLRVLAEAAAAPFNILHACGPHAFLRELADYPVAAISWDCHGEGNPSIRAMRGVTEKTLITGIDHEGTFVKGPTKKLEEEARAAVTESGGTRFILGAGCTVPAASPAEHYGIVREAALACA